MILQTRLALLDPHPTARYTHTITAEMGGQILTCAQRSSARLSPSHLVLRILARSQVAPRIFYHTPILFNRVRSFTRLKDLTLASHNKSLGDGDDPPWATDNCFFDLACAYRTF